VRKRSAETKNDDNILATCARDVAAFDLKICIVAHIGFSRKKTSTS